MTKLFGRMKTYRQSDPGVKASDDTAAAHTDEAS